MPRRSAPEPDPKAFTQSSIAIASLVGMIVSAFASVFMVIALVKGAFSVRGLGPDAQTQLVGALVPIATLIASAVAFFARVFKKEQAPIVAVTKAGVRKVEEKRRALAESRTRKRASKPPPAP